MHGTFLVIFQVFHDFQSLWEPCYLQTFCTCLYVHKNSCKISNRSKINSRRCCADTILLDFSFTVKEATLIFISGCGSAISFAKEGKSGFIYNFVKINKLFEPRKRACIL